MKTWIYSSLVCITTLLISGCSNLNTSVKTTEIKGDNSLLWKVEKNDQPVSYLFGTMHLIEPEYYDFPETLEALIKSCDAIVMEIGGMPDPLKAMAMLMLQNQTLEDIFTPEEYTQILQFFNDKMGVSQAQFKMTYNSFKPLFLFQSITQAYFSSDAKSIDLRIMEIAKEKDITLKGLETVEQQISLFDNIPSNELTKMILASMDSFERDKADLAHLQSLYHDQKVNELLPLMKEQSPELMEFEDLFLNDRNKNWIPKLESEFEDKSCFVAVGAAHLFGEIGVISLLRQKGFKITAIQK